MGTDGAKLRLGRGLIISPPRGFDSSMRGSWAVTVVSSHLEFQRKKSTSPPSSFTKVQFPSLNAETRHTLFLPRWFWRRFGRCGNVGPTRSRVGPARPSAGDGAGTGGRATAARVWQRGERGLADNIDDGAACAPYANSADDGATCAATASSWLRRVPG